MESVNIQMGLNSTRS